MLRLTSALRSVPGSGRASRTRMNIDAHCLAIMKPISLVEIAQQVKRDAREVSRWIRTTQRFTRQHKRRQSHRRAL